MAVVVSLSPEQTEEIGEQFGKTLPQGSVVCFFGDLAAGKTTFIKGLVAGACRLDPLQVCSPTFVYLNIYEGAKTLFHFDLYRLKGSQEFLGMGFDEYMGGEGICCIEWSERIEELLPPSCIKVEMTHIGENKRKIVITP